MRRAKVQGLSTEEIVQAAVNTPLLADVTFKLGDKELPILDLPYDDYIQFLALLQPFLEAFTGQLAKAAGLGVADSSNETAGSLLKYCGQTLPDMVQIIARQSMPEITVSEIKKQAKTPFKMVEIVMKQIDKNNMIGDIADFFVQILPYLRAGKKLATPPTTAETTL